jgi:stress response protein YsnF
VRAYTREVPVEERVTLRDETVHVERRPASSGRTLTGADADAAFQDREVVMEEHDEEAVISKETVVTGEVAVSKDVETREEVVQDTVRKTEVDVEGEAERGTLRGDDDLSRR